MQGELTLEPRAKERDFLKPRQAPDRVVDLLHCGASLRTREEVAREEASLMARLDAASDRCPEVFDQETGDPGRRGNAEPTLGLFEIEGEMAAFVTHDSRKEFGEHGMVCSTARRR